MPPKARYTKEQITDVAYGMVRKYGSDMISARNLAAELGTSTSPIFAAFESIDEVLSAVEKKAERLYVSYLSEGLAQLPAFKGAGLKYIQFAKDEPELFKFLFMRPGSDEPSHYLPAGFKFEPTVRSAVGSVYQIDPDKAKWVYNHLSVYTHGLAVLFAQGNCVFTDEDVSRMLSEVFMALTKE